jgi:hypothetical protein
MKKPGYKVLNRILPCGAVVETISHMDNSNKPVYNCKCKCGNYFLKRSGSSMMTAVGCKECVSTSKANKRFKDRVGQSWENGTYVVSLNKHEDNDFYWNVYCASCDKIYVDKSSMLCHPSFSMKCPPCRKKKVDLTGYKFGNGCMVLFEICKSNNSPNRRWAYQCRCGNISFCSHYHIVNTIQECQLCAHKTTGQKQSGEAHWNYNPNLTLEDRLDNRNSSESLKWKREVLKKNGYKCIITDSTENIQIHHIYNYAQYKHLRTDINNGVPMTEEMHKKFHSIYGRKNNDVHQLNEFILNN